MQPCENEPITTGGDVDETDITNTCISEGRSGKKTYANDDGKIVV